MVEPHSGLELRKVMFIYKGGVRGVGLGRVHLRMWHPFAG